MTHHNQQLDSLLFALNKPLGISSHDCVSAVRRILKTKKVGHAGTLDPYASGVLILGVGSATKLLQFIAQDNKRYRARIAFGIQTQTDDAQGAIISSHHIPKEFLDYEYAQEVLAGICGEQKQIPPQVSAISKDGIRAYKLVRKGIEVNLSARDVTIYSACLHGIESFQYSLYRELFVHKNRDDFENNLSKEQKYELSHQTVVVWDVEFFVSKGCYIRSIARDLGLMTKTYAHVASLERIASGCVTLSQCYKLNEVEKLLDCKSEDILDPLQLISFKQVHALSEDDLYEMSFGRPIPFTNKASSTLQNGDLVALVTQNRLYGIWRVKGNHLVSYKNFTGGIAGVINE